MVGRLLTILLCLLGWLALVGGVLLPAVGVGLALFDDSQTLIDAVSTPSLSLLLIRSTVLGLIAATTAVLLGTIPGILLGGHRGRWWPIGLGMLLAPLFIPPQVYAYAWDLASGAIPASRVGKWVCVVRAGLVTASWLWPIVALIVADGWRNVGRPVSVLARLDASSWRAAVRAALPAMFPYIGASAAVVFAVAVLEYSIPLMSYARVHASELTQLVNLGAPPREIVRIGLGGVVLVAFPIGWAAWILKRTAFWQEMPSDMGKAARIGWPAWGGTVVVWSATVLVPIALMMREVQTDSWLQGFKLFGREWVVSLLVAGLAGLMAMGLAVAVVLFPRARQSVVGRWLALPAIMTAIVPPALLAIGSVIVWNRYLEYQVMNWFAEVLPWAEPCYRWFVEQLYTEWPIVVSLSLLGRYGAVGLLAVWLTTSRFGEGYIEQARSDGAGTWTLLSQVILPMSRWSLMACGMIVVLLSMGDIVLTDDVLAPVGYNMLAPTLVGYMHYGRDEVVITTSIFMVLGGVILAQLCAWMLLRDGLSRDSSGS